MATAYVNCIQWDTTTDEDPDGLEKHELPTCFEFELDLNDFINEDAISDWITGELSDETGWCVSGFNYVISEGEKMKPVVKLSGVDGNVFSIIGTMTRSMKAQGLFKESQEFSRKAMDCHSYDAVLQLCCEYADIR